MLVDFDALSPGRIYHTMIQTVVPRPIAWVLSDNGDDTLNLAPFSYFNAVSSRPPLLMLSVGLKADGSPKDTRRNVTEGAPFVVHIAHRDQAPLVTASSRPLAHGESELAALDLPTVPFDGFPLPRLRGCRVAFACECHAVQTLGEVPQALIFGRIRRLWLDDTVAGQDTEGRIRVDMPALDPLSRLGGDDYGFLGGTLTVPRPRE